jgi:predicted nucleic acid-binding protein
MDYNINMNKEENNLHALVDTNVFIYTLEGKFNLSNLQADSLSVSIISYIELVGKKDITTDEILQVKQLLKGVQLIRIDQSIENMTVDIKQHRIVKVPDAIIAATAIEYNLTLVTADVKLAKVDGLKVKLVQPEIIDTQKNNELN